VRALHGSGEDEGGPLAWCTEELGAGDRGTTGAGARRGGVRTGETEGEAEGGDRWGPGPQCPGLNPNQIGQCYSKF
jgi:hypothetical protein